MIKAVIFDFDGVIIESAQLKTEAFKNLFSRWPDKVEEIVLYHLKNMGISRYVKFRYYFENILQKPYNEEIEAELGRQFSKIVLSGVKEAPFVDGALDFLEKKYREYMLFIASGTPGDELDEIMTHRGIKKYFKEIFGTPSTKTEIVTNIMEKYGLQKTETVFVGDAESDKKAARDSGIPFVLRITPENFHLMALSKYMMENLTQLEEQIGKIEDDTRM
ncbi:MAG: HAD family hydrolase [Pseudomonadota bacterium]